MIANENSLEQRPNDVEGYNFMSLYGLQNAQNP